MLRTYFFWIIMFAVQAVWIVNSDGFYFIEDSRYFNYNRHYLDSFAQGTGAWHRIEKAGND